MYPKAYTRTEADRPVFGIRHSACKVPAKALHDRRVHGYVPFKIPFHIVLFSPAVAARSAMATIPESQNPRIPESQACRNCVIPSIVLTELQHDP